MLQVHYEHFRRSKRAPWKNAVYKNHRNKQVGAPSSAAPSKVPAFLSKRERDRSRHALHVYNEITYCVACGRSASAQATPAKQAEQWAKDCAPLSSFAKWLDLGHEPLFDQLGWQCVSCHRLSGLMRSTPCDHVPIRALSKRLRGPAGSFGNAKKAKAQSVSDRALVS